MLIYPQLATGALGQFPIVRKRTARTVVNFASDGTRFVYADPAGGALEWRLRYTGLSDGELSALQAFHSAAEGSLNSFTFVDPTANLLSATDDLSNSAWIGAPLLSLTSGVADSLGGNGGWQVVNQGGGVQSITQTINAPAGYLYCLSVYARSAQATGVTLLSGSNRLACSVGTDWARLQMAQAGDASANSITFGIEIPAGTTLDLFGPQVEAQGSASTYKPSTSGGVYEGARLADDTFRFTTTDVNRHSTTVTIFYAIHL